MSFTWCLDVCGKMSVGELNIAELKPKLESEALCS